MSSLLPVPKEVRDLFEDLLGRPITVGDAKPVLAEDLKTTLVSLYADDKSKLWAVVGMDLPLTVYSGAAIGLLPPGGAQDCVADGVVTETVAENVREVCNIMTGLLNREDGPHLKLYQVFLPGEQVPSDAGAILLALGRRIDLTVQVGGYGSGRVSVALAE
ncbi:hypothetical protein HC028_18000 [Planosporangium flavigriseum]|uniref:Uncharacterized protein n=1 Tax=Planosporangium flavigriseum TaxID=373681 RepID=A0A8J3LP02_9ACTN|nr:hypothetical protein [Planosporangium flavigriseum]NJC66384.1 hypothetical protein [Planosporangium flavigriseum]GIG74210.1 hypothetical protein Pfl04_26140 [Planosporangium flavigriseum]